MSSLLKGLSKDIVEKISSIKKEPKWMLEFRLKCLDDYTKMHLPKWGPNLDELNLNDIESYVFPKQKIAKSWAEVPNEIRKTFDELGIPKAEKDGLAGVGAQYDSELIYHNIKSAVAKKGVVYLGIEDALKSRKYGKMVHEHFMKLIQPTDHLFAALHGAVWSGGSFVYVPPYTTVEFPLQAYYRFNAPGAGQFEHTLIIVDEGADLHFIEGCSAPKYNIANLHAGAVEIYVEKCAHVKFSTVENWSKNMYNLNSKRAIVKDGGSIEWVAGSFGSRVSMLYPMTILDGNNSSCEYSCVSFSSSEQNLDTGVKVLHKGSNTRSLINSKSISKDGGKNTFRNFIKVEKDAKNVKSFTNCQSLMLDSESISTTIPFFDIRNNSADIMHEASVGKISKNEVDYLRARGLTEQNARSLIVRGFTNNISKELPLEYAMEMNNLIRLEMARNS